MFKLKYNFLALFQVMIGFLNFFLLMKVFGISDATDAYLIVSAIFGALLLLQMLTTEQFLFFYNDIKSKDKEDAHRFYHSALGVAAVTSVVMFIVSYFGTGFIVDIFVNNSDVKRTALIDSFFYIAVFELLVAPMQSLNQKLLNAEMYFSMPYILNIIPQFFVLLCMFYLYCFNIKEIEFLIYAKVVGAFFSFFISFIIVHKIDIKIKFRLQHKELKSFLKNSFSMRLGHNIHNFLFTPITTNLLTSLPSGYASYFYYAMKIATIINSIVVGPFTNVFQANFSKEWSNKHILNAKKLIFKYMKSVIPLIVVSSVIGYFLLPLVLNFLIYNSTNESVVMIQRLFAGLMIWQFIILVESGSVFILIVEKQSKMFIYTNLIFSMMYFGFANYFLDEFSIYGVIYSLIISQIVNFMIYTYYGQKTLQQRLKQYEA